MKYLDWNHSISSYFFNSSKAGREILLYITKKEISELGVKNFGFNTLEESWEDYCKALKGGFPGTSTKPSFMEKFNIINDKWRQYEKWVFEQKNLSLLRMEEISIRNEDGIVPPFYIGFLTALIIPLTDNSNEYRANAYYPRLNKFLKENNISNPDVGVLNFTYDIWKNLEKWSKEYYQTDLGFFEKRSFGNSNWIHVGKPFSQCILTPKNIRDIPNLFWAGGLAPNSFLPEIEVRNIVRQHGQHELGLSKKVVEVICDKEDDLSKVIVDIIKREYEKWDGDVYEYDEGEEGMIKSGWVSSILYSAFTIDSVNDEIEHHYHVYSKNDYPEDLHLLENNISHLANGYSKPLKLVFDQNLNSEDKSNKWKISTNKSDLILYRNGAYAGLSNDIWIEAWEVSKASQMYLVCKDNKKTSVESWGAHFKPGNFKSMKLDGVPAGFFLYRFQHPTLEHPEEPILKFQIVKKIELFGGLKISNREYLKGALPKVFLKGGNGDEKIYLEYKDTNEKLYLINNTIVPEEYSIPNSVKCNEYFLIKAEGEQLTGYVIPYKIVEPEINPFLIDEKNLTKRNKYGEVANLGDTSHVIGSNTVYDGWTHQQPCAFAFFSVFYMGSSYSNSMPTIAMDRGNLLLQYLTCLNEIRYDDFSNGFDYIASKVNLWEGLNENPKWVKQLSIQFFDFLGFLDYDYLLNKIVVNKPQLAIIPSEKSVVAVLIGARTQEALEKLFTAASKYNINVEVIPQFTQLAKYLLPDTVKLTPADCASASEAIKKLEKLSAEINLVFKSIPRPTPQPAILQFGLQDFSSNLFEYKQHMLANNIVEEKDYPWARKTFNINSLKFEIYDGAIDTKLTLIKYVLKYNKFYRLWYEGKCYKIDEEWGTYFIASENKKKIIFYSVSKLVLAVPRNMQLPRLISESLMLLSGQAPLFKTLELEANYIVYQLYQNIPKLFAENLFKKFNQEIQPLNL